MARHENSERPNRELTKRSDFYQRSRAEARKKDLSESGLSGKWISKVQKRKPAMYSVAFVRERVQGLSERGFVNPHKMVEISPRVLSYSLETIDKKLKGL